jgi:hypothetical protein
MIVALVTEICRTPQDMYFPGAPATMLSALITVTCLVWGTGHDDAVENLLKVACRACRREGRGAGES